ncbi:MAG: hypothetical protein NVS3B25_19010 [Hymenobacter sp.]
MAHPKAYEPAQNEMFQIFTRAAGQKEWEHCDYADSFETRKYLLAEYRLAYGAGFEFKSILLPRKYWPVKVAVQQ